jgi:hypothetical protein
MKPYAVQVWDTRWGYWKTCRRFRHEILAVVAVKHLRRTGLARVKCTTTIPN